jgi:hypothetical protein
VEGLVAGVLLILLRFKSPSDDSLSGGIALGGTDNLDVDGVGLVEEGREMLLAAFFCDDDAEDDGVMIDPRTH